MNNDLSVDRRLDSVINWYNPNDTLPTTPTGANYSREVLVVFEGRIALAKYSDEDSLFLLDNGNVLSTLPVNHNAAIRVTAWAKMPTVPPCWL